MKLFIALCAILGCQLALAETCPSIHDINNQLISDWRAFDSDDGQPLSAEQMNAFSKNVAQFALAEWSKNQENGEIRCYYRDLDGSSLDAYLSKKNYFPDDGMRRWYEVSGHMHCAAGMDKCIFNNPTEQHRQLANKQ